MEESERAIEIATQIQALFAPDRRHPRLLRAKLWAFEACVDAGRLDYAERGLIGVTKLAGPTTRLYLEASSLLSICYLRQRKTPDAKRLIRDVIRHINNIESERTRHAFQKRLIERLEEECILVELVDTGMEPMDVDEVHSKAVLLVQRSSDDDIFKLIGHIVPASGIQLLDDVREYSIKLLSRPDQALLPSPVKATEAKQLGKTAFAILRRVTWKTLCSRDSSIYSYGRSGYPRSSMKVTLPLQS